MCLYGNIVPKVGASFKRDYRPKEHKLKAHGRGFESGNLSSSLLSHDVVWLWLPTPALHGPNPKTNLMQNAYLQFAV